MPKISVVVYHTMTLFRIGLDFVRVSSFLHFPQHIRSGVARAASRPSDRSNSLRDVQTSTDNAPIIPRLIYSVPESDNLGRSRCGKLSVHLNPTPHHPTPPLTLPHPTRLISLSAAASNCCLRIFHAREGMATECIGHEFRCLQKLLRSCTACGHALPRVCACEPRMAQFLHVLAICA